MWKQSPIAIADNLVDAMGVGIVIICVGEVRP